MKNEAAAHRHLEVSAAVRVILSDEHLGKAVNDNAPDLRSRARGRLGTGASGGAARSLFVLSCLSRNLLSRLVGDFDRHLGDPAAVAEDLLQVITR